MPMAGLPSGRYYCNGQGQSEDRESGEVSMHGQFVTLTRGRGPDAARPRTRPRRSVVLL
jgi:hypothetical protein